MRTLILAASLVALVGCATLPQGATPLQGVHQAKTTPANDQRMADDLVKQLVKLYPPANTRFDLEQPTPDHFGTYLVESMRAKGYAVSEFQTATAAAAGTPASAGLPLAYLVDQPAGAELVRLKVTVSRQQSLDRIYQFAGDGSLHPAGYWVRKE